MAQRERRTGIWMTLVTALWIAFAIGLVVLILFAAGILGPSAGNGEGDESAAVAEQNDGSEGEDADGESDQADDAHAQDDDAEAEQNGEDDVRAVFTSEQADRGQQVFSQSCAECHGGQLDWDPPLTGETFVSTWDGMPVHALYEIISQTMPQDEPGSLSNEEYEDVTAHILAFNGMPDGDGELDAQDTDAMEVTLRLGGDAGATAEDEATDEDSGDAMADAPDGDDGAPDGDNGGDTDGEADGEADAEAEAEAEGESEADSTAVEAEDPADDEEPGSDEGWIEVNVEPASATVNIIGPGGYVGQMSGGGTLTGLEPGAYIATASLGNFSHRMDAQVRSSETVTLNLRIDELAMSSDVGAGGQDDSGEDSADAEASAEGDEGGDEAAEGSNGEASGNDEANGNGNGEADGDTADSDESGDENGNGNGDEAWYTEDQAATGADEYSASCASCHNDDGTGDPPLVDGALEGSFDTVWDLFSYTSSEMPQDSPGSLDEETYLVITAHLLEMNDYPAGDEELEADEDAMSEMSLDGDGNGNGADGDDGAQQEDAEGDTAQQDEAADGAQEEADTSGARGASMYSTNCAMCHGPSLEGISAPPLAGPVFMDRWGGHPVDWLYFQARTSMPPDNPGTLDDEAYVDIMVHILAENGFLEGDEQFGVQDPALVNMIIGGPEQQDFGLHARIDALRRQLHEPFAPEDADSEDDATQVDEVGVPEVPDEPSGNGDGEGEGEQPEDEGAGNGNGEEGGDGGEDNGDGGEDDGDGGEGEDDGASVEPEETAIPAEGGERED